MKSGSSGVTLCASIQKEIQASELKTQMRSAPHKYAATDAQSAKMQPAIRASFGPCVYCKVRLGLHQNNFMLFLVQLLNYSE